jgi:hypothetical protein
MIFSTDPSVSLQAKGMDMGRDRLIRIMRFGLWLIVCMVSASALDCRHASKPQKSDSLPCPPETVSALRNENATLKQALQSSGKTVQRLKQELSALKIKVAEKDARIGDLLQRSEEQQKHMEAAIVDVVRSKAKLRSLESKAEAASTIAEAEIALKTLQSMADASDWVAMDEIAIAAHLLEMSTQEFDAENFGGALYLANQAKGRVRSAQNRLSSMAVQVAPFTGEAASNRPVQLKVVKNSNLRSGPGLKYTILAQLKAGTPVLGLEYKDGWIYIQVSEQRTGWIFQPLVTSR